MSRDRLAPRQRDQGDDAGHAVDELRAQLVVTIGELQSAADRLEHLVRLRAAGRSWTDIVSQEDRPLIVETITGALDALGAVGGRFRREEALALRREGLSITRIGQLFGVSRQRISVLVREHLTSPSGFGHRG